MYTLEQIKEYAKERGGKCTSGKYKNSTWKLNFKCMNDHKFSETPLNVMKKGKWCPECTSASSTMFNLENIEDE